MERKNFIRNAALLAIGLRSTGMVNAGTSLQNNITASATTMDLMVNAGVAGNTTKNLLARIDKDCLAHKPTLTIMMSGTNDMTNGKHVPPDKFTDNMTILSEKIMKSGSKLVLMTILPFYEPYYLSRHPKEFFEPEGPEGRRKAVNEAIKKVAQKTGAFLFDPGILFEKVGKIGLDAGSLLRNEANSTKTDGVHPTRDGYRFLALGVSQFIQYNHLPFSRTVCFGDSITKGDGSIDGESYPAYLKKLLQ
jgi:lysophospholipase L1-like esterase